MWVSRARPLQSPTAYSQPPGDSHGAELVVDVDGAARLKPDRLQAERPGRRAATHGDKDLVGLDLAAVGERGDYRTIRTLPPGGGQGDAEDDRDALRSERSRKLVTGEVLLPAEEPLAGFDHRDLLAAEPAERLSHLGADGAAAQHQQAAG